MFRTKGRQMAKKPQKVALPGEVYQKNGRWWWKVKLPGESRLKARGLKPEGARYATKDWEQACELALAMWESAIAAQVRAAEQQKATEKTQAAAEEISRAKAEADKKVAEIKAEADAAVASARAGAEQTVQRMKTEVVRMIDRAKAECQQRLAQCEQSLARAREDLLAEVSKREQAEAKLAEILSAPKLGTCECCQRSDVPEQDLTRIDSGQLMCPQCLSAMRG